MLLRKWKLLKLFSFWAVTATARQRRIVFVIGIWITFSACAALWVAAAASDSLQDSIHLCVALATVDVLVYAGHAPSNLRGKSYQDDPSQNPCAQSGPSIHDGPKAFAQMTGLGADGIPHPNGALPLCELLIFL